MLRKLACQNSKRPCCAVWATFLLLGRTPVAQSSTLAPGGGIDEQPFVVAIDEIDCKTKGGEALLDAADHLAREDRGETSPSPWYAIWTRSNCERLVAEQLSAKGFTAFLPEMGARSRRNGTSHVVQVPMFPGYLFLRHAMEKASYIEILKARGIVRILEGGWSRLTPVADEDVDAIHQLVASGVPVFPHAYFREGDRVRVVEGPLVGLEGSFVRDKPHKGRLVVSVNLLQTSVAVEVDCALVEALPRSRAH